jgi:hypothetical protein
MLTARKLNALIVNLHDSELDLPFIICFCWNYNEQTCSDMVSVKPTEIILHRAI